jgi:hypothetical protein
MRQLIDKDLQTQFPLHRRYPTGRREAMVQLQFAQQTLVRHTILSKELLAYLPVKGGYEVARQILIDSGFVLEPTRNFDCHALYDLSRTGCIVKFPLHTPVGPWPKPLSDGDNARVDWPSV